MSFSQRGVSDEFIHQKVGEKLDREMVKLMNDFLGIRNINEFSNFKTKTNEIEVRERFAVLYKLFMKQFNDFFIEQLDESRYSDLQGSFVVGIFNKFIIKNKSIIKNKNMDKKLINDRLSYFLSNLKTSFQSNKFFTASFFSGSGNEIKKNTNFDKLWKFMTPRRMNELLEIKLATKRIPQKVVFYNPTKEGLPLLGYGPGSGVSSALLTQSKEEINRLENRLIRLQRDLRKSKSLEKEDRSHKSVIKSLKDTVSDLRNAGDKSVQREVKQNRLINKLEKTIKKLKEDAGEEEGEEDSGEEEGEEDSGEEEGEDTDDDVLSPVLEIDDESSFISEISTMITDDNIHSVTSKISRDGNYQKYYKDNPKVRAALFERFLELYTETMMSVSTSKLTKIHNVLSYNVDDFDPDPKVVKNMKIHYPNILRNPVSNRFNINSLLVILQSIKNDSIYTEFSDRVKHKDANESRLQFNNNKNINQQLMFYLSFYAYNDIIMMPSTETETRYNIDTIKENLEEFLQVVYLVSVLSYIENKTGLRADHRKHVESVIKNFYNKHELNSSSEGDSVDDAIFKELALFITRFREEYSSEVYANSFLKSFKSVVERKAGKFTTDGSIKHLQVMVDTRMKRLEDRSKIPSEFFIPLYDEVVISIVKKSSVDESVSKTFSEIVSGIDEKKWIFDQQKPDETETNEDGEKLLVEIENRQKRLDAISKTLPKKKDSSATDNMTIRNKQRTKIISDRLWTHFGEQNKLMLKRRSRRTKIVGILNYYDDTEVKNFLRDYISRVEFNVEEFINYIVRNKLNDEFSTEEDGVFVVKEASSVIESFEKDHTQYKRMQEYHKKYMNFIEQGEQPVQIGSEFIGAFFSRKHKLTYTHLRRSDEPMVSGKGSYKFSNKNNEFFIQKENTTERIVVRFDNLLSRGIKVVDPLTLRFFQFYDVSGRDTENDSFLEIKFDDLKQFNIFFSTFVNFYNKVAKKEFGSKTLVKFLDIPILYKAKQSVFHKIKETDGYAIITPYRSMKKRGTVFVYILDKKSGKVVHVLEDIVEYAGIEKSRLFSFFQKGDHIDTVRQRHENTGLVDLSLLLHVKNQHSIITTKTDVSYTLLTMSMKKQGIPSSLDKNKPTKQLPKPIQEGDDDDDEEEEEGEYVEEEEIEGEYDEIELGVNNEDNDIDEMLSDLDGLDDDDDIVDPQEEIEIGVKIHTIDIERTNASIERHLKKSKNVKKESIDSLKMLNSTDDEDVCFGISPVVRPVKSHSSSSLKIGGKMRRKRRRKESMTASSEDENFALL